MLNKVRKFLCDRSPDWLNTEVNKDLLQNLSTAISPTKTISSSISYDNNYSPRPSLGEGLGEGLGERADLQNDRPLMRSDCLLNTAKGKPHWRRINQVFQTLDTAPENATYNQLIEYVKETTGVGCSRKLISKWKKQNTSHKFPDHNNDYAARSLADRHLEKNTAAMRSALASPIACVKPIISNIPSTACQEMGVNSFQFTETSNNSTNNNSLITDVRANGETLSLGGFPDLRKVSNPKGCSPLITVKTWSYLTAAGLMASLVGCEIIPLNNNQLTENVAFASVTTSLPPLPPTPETRKNRLEPNNIKIELTLNNPQDLKVKPGDKVSAGQTLSNRASERNRLQAKKKQLQLSIEKLNLPLTPIPQPRPIPEINSLPPVSYAEEEAEIKLKQQKLTEAEQAIALAQKKIDSINQLLTNSPDKPTTEKDNLKLVIEHEQANLKNLETAKTDAQIQLEVSQSQLTTAKEQRAYIEYQRQLEQTRRAIAISQQHQAIQRTESERQVLLAEREYSIAQIETQIQEIDYQIEQLSTVKAPYEGTIKKVKWTGQSDHNLTAVVTLSVTSDRSTIANSRVKSVNSQQ